MLDYFTLYFFFIICTYRVLWWMHTRGCFPQRKQKCHLTRPTLLNWYTAQIMNYFLFEEAQLCWYICPKNVLTSLFYYSEQVTTVQRPRVPCFEFQRLTLERPASLFFYCGNVTLLIFFIMKCRELWICLQTSFCLSSLKRLRNEAHKCSWFLVWKRRYCHLICFDLHTTLIFFTCSISILTKVLFHNDDVNYRPSQISVSVHSSNK